jgi:hypothetical protein
VKQLVSREVWVAVRPRSLCPAIRTAADGVVAVAARPRRDMPNLEDPMASSGSTCCCCSGASRRWGVAVSALFSVIFICWRWLFPLLGGG